MKKTHFILILILVLGVIAAVFALRTNRGTIKKELRDFAIQDTASIDRIFMVRKDMEQVTLTRNGDHWLVNGSHVAREEAIDILLKTLNRIRVKSPVSKAAYNNVVTMLATRNTKVEVYRKNKLIRTIYVGGPTQDQMGTYMMLEGSSAPFVVHMPGFVGYLSTRFFTNEAEWRSQNLFKTGFNELSRIEVHNNLNPQESFVIEKDPAGRLDLYQYTTGNRPARLDTVGVNFFLSHFERFGYEFRADSMPPARRDSLEVAVPMRTLKVSSTSGAHVQIDAHQRYANGKLNFEGEPLIWDDERMYAWVNRKEWVVIQYYTYQKMFRDYSEFLPFAP